MRPPATPRARLPALLLAALTLSGCLGGGAQAPEEAAEPAPQENAQTREPLQTQEEPAAKTVRVTIDALHAPHGGAPIAIDRRLYGVNVADWSTDDYRPEPDPEFVAFLDALSPGILRWPAGESSQQYVWERSRRADDAPRVLTAEHVDDFVALARAVRSEPVIAVNVKTGTPAEAADLVRYVNVEMGYDVRWWQVGNEPDFPDGLTRGPRDYARDLVAFARAMREVDPSIRIVGGELMTGAHVIGSNGARDWLTPILRFAGRQVDAVSWHYYPLDSSRESPTSRVSATVPNLLQEESPDWRPAGLTFVDEVHPALERARGRYAPGAEVWVTEYAEDPIGGGASGIVDTHAGALWTAEVLGRFAAHGTDAMARFVFKSGKDHNFTLLDPDNLPRPSYYAYWLYANRFGDRLVAAESDAKEDVNAHAALRQDGALAVVVVNKATEPRVVELTYEGFSPGAAERDVVVADGYASRDATLNGERLTSENVRTGPPPEPVDDARAVRVPPLSVTMLVVEPARGG